MPETTLYVRVKQALTWLKRDKGILQKDVADKMGMAEASFTRALMRIKEKNDESFVIAFHSATNNRFSLDYLLNGQGTVRNYHKDINALLGRALKFGMITSNPYDRMKGEIKRGDNETVEYLTKDELKRMEQLELEDGTMLSVARDLFIFQAYTGMGYSDMQAFTLDDCRHDGDRWILAKRRVKTNVVYYVQLLPPALAVAQKYGGQLPQIAVQVYNRNLHAVAEMAKIKKRVTSHVGRHTFATWALHEKVPIERVSKMLGHANIRQTQRYAKVLAKDVYDEFDKLNKSL